MDMHLISDTFSYTHDLNRSGRAPVKAFGVALLALLAVLLALPQLARAAGEVTPLREPMGGALITPLAIPSVLTIEPSSGPTSGATAVKIKGTEFVTGATVTIGGVAATEVKVVSAEEITAKTPAGTAGAQPVVVTDANGSSSGGAQYTYVAAPTVTGVSPGGGAAAGGTTVIITGTNLSAATAVKFGPNAATVKTDSATSIEAASPSGTGKVDVTVTTVGGTSAKAAGDEFTYAPTVSSVEPSSGPTIGGTAVKIKGTGFVAGSTVTIGGAAASEVKISTELEITAKTPPGTAGAQEVVVTDAGGASIAGPKYTYVPAPTVTGVSPGGGAAAGGTTVTITGTNLTGATAVKFGANAATGLKVNSDTSAEAVSPAGTGRVAVAVTTAGGTSAAVPADEFTYAPTAASITPLSGPTAGGTPVTIKGTGFVTGSTVTIGGAAASEVKISSEQELTARTPPGTVGQQAVVVSDSGGPSVGGPTFLYLEAPTVTSITPSSGPTAGGTTVTIDGSGYLAGVQSVRFGSTSVTGYTVNGAGTQITATSPAGTGTVNVTVTTLKGTSATSPADEFTYTTPVIVETPPTNTGGGGGGQSGSGTGGSSTSTGSTGPTVVTTGLAAPVLGRTANILAVVGHVSVRLPGARAFANLSSARQIPFGTIVEATRGEVSVTAARPGGGTQRGQFFDGEFVLTQASNGQVLATLAGGDFTVCRPQAGTARAKAKPRSKFAAATHLVRRLWSEAKGNFSTRARYAGTVVQGGQWLTEDMCEGSLVLATREHVEVTDLVRHRHVLVPTGGIYLVKPR
jgi:hypothetical protein